MRVPMGVSHARWQVRSRESSVDDLVSRLRHCVVLERRRDRVAPTGYCRKRLFSATFDPVLEAAIHLVHQKLDGKLKGSTKPHPEQHTEVWESVFVVPDCPPCPTPYGRFEVQLKRCESRF